MKRLLNSFKWLTLVALLISVMSGPVTPSVPAQGGDIVFTDENGKLWVCYIMCDSENFCYYECERWD
jgi:hypothetical protein